MKSIFAFTLVVTYQLLEGLPMVVKNEECDSPVCIRVEGHFQLNKTVTLKCNINSFTGGLTAEWVMKNNTTNNTVSNCVNNGFCSKVTDENTSFSSNIYGIAVEFRPLLEKDLNNTWFCVYQDEKDFITIASQSDQTNQGTNIRAQQILITFFGCVILLSVQRL